jgi:transposase
LNLEVDLLFFDTTSTYFETDRADDPAEGATVGFRTYGKSKDHRPDLPQVVIGMAVTRSGIPIRVWTWPGNTGDSTLIRQVKDDLRAWKLTRVVWVADRGFSSEENRRYLQRASGHYIIGEKLRSDSPEPAAALARQGRYRTVADNLEVKEVIIDDATMRDRFVICRNPDQAARDRTVRDQLLAQLADLIAGSDTLAADDRADLAARLRTKPGYRRFLRETPGGLLRIDRAAVTAEERLDGKFLLRTSDPSLSAEDVALGYKQLLEVERGWRDMKQIIDLRPVYHRREDRIRAHVLLCWLALLLIRVAETTAGESWTWNRIRTELQRLHAVTYTGTAGTFRQATAPSKPQRDLLAALKLDPPKKIIEIASAP